MLIVMLAGGWIGVIALFIPGTGIIEFVAAAGLLIGGGALLVAGGNVLGLLFIGASFVIYALTILRRVTRSDGPPDWSASAWLVGIGATVVQVIGLLLLATSFPALSVVLGIVLALTSLALYRWLLLPVVTALRPDPQSGAEALIGDRAVVRFAPEAPGKPGMVFLNGELWQAVADEPLAVDDEVRIVAREDMRLYVRKESRE
jgi:membrane-bound serine protease (ClpP class)